MPDTLYLGLQFISPRALGARSRRMSVDYTSYLPRNVLAVQSTLVNNECPTKVISYKNVVRCPGGRLFRTIRQYQGVTSPDPGGPPNQSQGCRIPLWRFQIAGSEIAGWPVQ